MSTQDITMEALLAQETAAEASALRAMSDDQPLENIIAAVAEYRVLNRAVIFSDFTLAKDRESHLWNVHLVGRSYFSKQLKSWRREQGKGRQLAVQIRVMVDAYLKFIRHSVRFYREHVIKLSQVFGLPELEAVAQQMHQTDRIANLIMHPEITPELHSRVLDSCHQSVIYLGDLSRWRAQDCLDKNPDIGPAIGFYGLASTIRPQSGIGQHQLATIALRVPQHLRGIYYLYRAICVEEPHPLARKNLETEFNMTQIAWTKNELIEKGPPNDPDARKKALVGWFVRLHSMCSKAEVLRGYEELEREVMGQLATELKHRSLGATLSRMVLVNIAAQHVAIENYQEDQSSQNEQAFYAFLRINLRTYTTLLSVLQADLLQVARDPDMADADLADKLLPASDRVLPALRLYSSWLLLNTRLLFGLTQTPFLSDTLKDFWRTYGRTLDLVATNFTIWDLEDVTPITYMLEEDADILGFKPFDDDGEDVTRKLWVDKQTGSMKPRWNNVNVTRASRAEENLARIYGFLVDGLYVANDLEESPIKIQGARVFYGNGNELEQLIMPATLEKPVEKPAPQVVNTAPAAQKPMSYAAAAATAKQTSRQYNQTTKAEGASPALSAGQSQHAQDVRMSRMVDDLVEEDDTNNPVTPPQPFASNPAVAQSNGDFAPNSLRDSTPDWRQPKGNGNSHYTKAISRPNSKHFASSSAWKASPAATPGTPADPRYVSAHPVGTLGSPAPNRKAGHSRVNSANSARSRMSQNVSDSWASLEMAPQGSGMNAVARNGVVTIPSISNAGEEALLFGAGGGIWNTGGGRTSRTRWSFGATGFEGGFGG